MPFELFNPTEITIDSAGTFEDLTSEGEADRLVVSVTVQADNGNVGTGVVGGVGVTFTSGNTLGPGDSAVIDAPILRGAPEEFLLSNIKVTSSTTGDKFRVAAWRKK